MYSKYNRIVRSVTGIDALLYACGQSLAILDAVERNQVVQFNSPQVAREY